MAIEIISPGLASTIQDQGRPGYYRWHSPSEPLTCTRRRPRISWLAMIPTAALIEATYMGPQSLHRANRDRRYGAQIPALLNGIEVPQWESFSVDAGDELSFGILQAGARIYIAATGGIDVPVVLGSRSTYALGAFGGLHGRALQAGDVLELGDAVSTAGRSIPDGSSPRARA